MAKNRYVVGFTNPGATVYGKRPGPESDRTGWSLCTDPMGKREARKRLDWLDRASGDVAIYKLVEVKKVKKEKGYVQKEG